MTDTLLTRIDAPIGCILHIGAGTGDDIPGYLAACADAVILLEPDPTSLPQLLAAAAGHDTLRVIEAAVSPDPDAGVLHRFSFGDLNSLRAPTALRNIFPGLEDLGSTPVALRDPVTLVGGLELGPDRAHVLVIEAPGEGLAIVQALEAAGLLGGFAAVRIQEGRRSLYKGAGTLRQVQALLKRAGFNRDAQIDDTDPDRPVLSVLFDPEVLRRRMLEDELEQVRAERDQLEATVSAGEAAQAVQEQSLIAAEARVAELEQVRVAQEQSLIAAEARVVELEESHEKQHMDREAGRKKLDELEKTDQQLALSREDMLRAEGQIEIIKDILLRGSEL